MFISNAYAQGAGAAGPDMGFFIMLGLMFVVFYFFLIRPQNKRRKEHQEMVASARRGDTVVTGGGIIGKVAKVESGEEITVEIADGVRIKVMTATLMDVRSKSAPVKDAANSNEKD